MYSKLEAYILKKLSKLNKQHISNIVQHVTI